MSVGAYKLAFVLADLICAPIDPILSIPILRKWYRRLWGITANDRIYPGLKCFVERFEEIIEQIDAERMPN